MKNLAKKILAVCLVAGAYSTMSYAQDGGGLFVEPSVSYERGEGSVQFPGAAESTGTTNGIGVGARLGFHINEVFFAGADARYSMVQFTNSFSDYDSKSNAYNLGPVVGIQMPNIGLRLWGAYVMDGVLDPNESDGLDVKFEDATGSRVGAAFRLAAMSIDIEYQQLTYGTTTVEQTGIFAPNASFDDVNLEKKYLLVSLSFPLEM